MYRVGELQLEKCTQNRKNNTAQLNNPGPKTSAGLCHGVHVEVDHHLLDRLHQRGDSVVSN